MIRSANEIGAKKQGTFACLPVFAHFECKFILSMLIFTFFAYLPRFVLLASFFKSRSRCAPETTFDRELRDVKNVVAGAHLSLSFSYRHFFRMAQFVTFLPSQRSSKKQFQGRIHSCTRRWVQLLSQ